MLITYAPSVSNKDWLEWNRTPSSPQTPSIFFYPSGDKCFS